LHRISADERQAGGVLVYTTAVLGG